MRKIEPAHLEAFLRLPREGQRKKLEAQIYLSEDEYIRRCRIVEFLGENCPLVCSLAEMEERFPHSPSDVANHLMLGAIGYVEWARFDYESKRDGPAMNIKSRREFRSSLAHLVDNAAVTMFPHKVLDRGRFRKREIYNPDVEPVLASLIDPTADMERIVQSLQTSKNPIDEAILCQHAAICDLRAKDEAAAEARAKARRKSESH